MTHTEDVMPRPTKGQEMTRRTRPITRAEARAQTREDVLDAAEELFLAVGYQAATVAEIADRAGRTQGSIYGNFSNKEALCLAVIKRRYMREFGSLTLSLSSCESPDQKIQTLNAWWDHLVSMHEWTTLVGEYMLATRRNAEANEQFKAYIDLVQETIARIVADQFELQAGASDLAAYALKAVVATGFGLALTQAAGVIDADESRQLMTDTVQLWLTRVTALVGAA